MVSDKPTPAQSGDGRGKKQVWQRVMLGSFLLCAGGIASIGLAYIWGGEATFWTLLLREAGSGLLIAGVTSGLVRVLIESNWDQIKEERAEFDRKRQQVHFNALESQMGTQAKRLIRMTTTLGALHTLGIPQVYAHRGEWAKRLKTELKHPQVTNIRVIGIALNDLLRGEKEEFKPIWDLIVKYVDRTQPLPDSTKQLNIQLLIINPKCQGARLRAVGENREFHATSGRLEGDVNFAVDALSKLKRLAQTKDDEEKRRGEKPRVKFEFKLYNLPPMLFLVQTNLVSYVQPYYFWGSRSYDERMPLFQCPSSTNLYDGLRDHFEFIWNQASIEPDELVLEHCVGTDNAVQQLRVRNIFVDPDDARKRILYLLEHTRSTLCIKGISLHSFFDADGQLYWRLKKLVERGVRVKLLLLDPECEQAKYRAFREWLIEQGETALPYEEWSKDSRYLKDSNLWKDTRMSIRGIRSLSNAGAQAQIEAHLYGCSPSCFVLIADDRAALLEQYHYGKLQESAEETGRSSVILGKDMALYEFERPITHGREDDVKLDSDDSGVTRDTFALLQDDFDFVFTKCSQLVSEAAVQAAGRARG